MSPPVQQKLIMITMMKEVIARDKTFLYYDLEFKDPGRVVNANPGFKVN